MGGFPHKGTIMWRSRVQATPNIICLHESIDSLPVQCRHPDDIAVGSISSG